MKRYLATAAVVGMMSSGAMVTSAVADSAQPVRLSDNAMDQVTAGNAAIALLEEVVRALQVFDNLPKGGIPAKGQLIRLDGKTILLCATTSCASAAGRNSVLIVGPGVAAAAASSAK